MQIFEILLTIKRRRGKSGKKGDHGLVGSPGIVGLRGKPVNFLIVKQCINNKNKYSTKYIQGLKGLKGDLGEKGERGEKGGQGLVLIKFIITIITRFQAISIWFLFDCTENFLIWNNILIDFSKKIKKNSCIFLDIFMHVLNVFELIK